MPSDPLEKLPEVAGRFAAYGQEQIELSRNGKAVLDLRDRPQFLGDLTERSVAWGLHGDQRRNGEPNGFPINSYPRSGDHALFRQSLHALMHRRRRYTGLLGDPAVGRSAIDGQLRNDCSIQIIHKEILSPYGWNMCMISSVDTTTNDPRTHHAS